MLLAVEGGGFFSASSSGFSKGLTLLLSRDKEDGDNRPLRVAPPYHLLLVDKHHSFIQLDSIKNRVSRGCASFSCFSCGGCASAGLETNTTTTTTTTTPCPVKVDSLQHPVVSSSFSVSVPQKDKENDAANKADDNTIKQDFKLSLRSSLKRPPSVAESPSLEGIKEHETFEDASDLTSNGDDDTGKRKVQWPDACGSELTQVREFEPSEMGLSDEEWETGRQRTCSCIIM